MILRQRIYDIFVILMMILIFSMAYAGVSFGEYYDLVIGFLCIVAMFGIMSNYHDE